MEQKQTIKPMKKGRKTKFFTPQTKTMTLKLFFLVAFLCLSSETFAQQGATGIQNAATKVSEYKDSVITLIKAVGGIVGLIGAVRIYNKWSNGDQDINKELVGWGGACVFLIVAPEFINSFFFN